MLSRQKHPHYSQTISDYKSFRISKFALSITEPSNDARYMRVVSSESCPMPSLMTEIGMFLLLAMLAQECLLTYMVSGAAMPHSRAISFRYLLMRNSVLLYWLRSFLEGSFRIGSR
jgi:hypothetical protein